MAGENDCEPKLAASSGSQTTVTLYQGIVSETIEPPPRVHLLREALGVFELPKLLVRFPILASQPRGKGQPVLVLPGYGVGNASTIVLQSYLRLLGYRVRGLGRKAGSGDIPGLLRAVMQRTMLLARRTEQKVHMIGWSLGGYLAREAARERPEYIHQVITLGTPVVGGPKYTAVAHSFRRRGIDVDAIALEVDARNAVSIVTPITAIYSRTDAVVAWQACIDRHGANVEHVEVASTHLGLGFSPEVYKIIAQRLAAAGRAPHHINETKLHPRFDPPRPS